MACLLLLLIVLFPRVALALLFLFTTYLDRVFHNLLILVAGFIFLPLTTLLYAWMVHNGFPVAGINFLWLFLAALIDLGGLGGGFRRRWGP
jgi:hypothetical protein